MSKRREGVVRSAPAYLLWQALAGLAWTVVAGTVSGCEDRLPAFADPPPVDAGDEDLDAAADEDAG